MRLCNVLCEFLETRKLEITESAFERVILQNVILHYQNRDIGRLRPKILAATLARGAPSFRAG